MSTKDNNTMFINNVVGMDLDPAFITKNLVLTFLPEDISIPEIKMMSSIAEDKLWCLVRALK